MICIASSWWLDDKEDGCLVNPTGCRRTRQPVTLRPMIPTQTLLTENALAEEFVSAFRERRLAEKFFYWFPLSVRACLALCSDGAYRNYVRSRSPIGRPPDPLPRHLAPRPPDVVTPC